MNYDAREELFEMIEKIGTTMPKTVKDEDLQAGRFPNIGLGRYTPVTRNAKKAAESKSRSPSIFHLPDSLATGHQSADDKPEAGGCSNAYDRIIFERCLRFFAPL